MKAISGAPRADDHGAGRRIERARAEIRRELARVDPALELRRCRRAGRRPGRARAASTGTRAARARRAGRRARSAAAARAIHVCRVDRNDRDDVRGADPRMRALVAAQVDPLPRHLDPRDERLDELVLVADEREHRAVVVRVGVHVEQPRVPRERRADRVDRRAARDPPRSSARTRAAAPSECISRVPSRQARYVGWMHGGSGHAAQQRDLFAAHALPRALQGALCGCRASSRSPRSSARSRSRGSPATSSTRSATTTTARCGS